MTDDTTIQDAPKENDEERQEEDIFLWSNNIVQYLESLKTDLYFFNKQYTVFKLKLGESTSRYVQPIFIDPILEAVFDGLEKGMVVRRFEDAASEDNVLQKTDTDKVDGLREVLSRIKTGDVEAFNQENHDIKRMKGVIAYSRHQETKPFFVIKALSAASFIKGEAAWLVQGDTFKPFDGLAGMKLPIDTQLMVIGKEVFVFKEPKLKQLFGYDVKAASIAEKKAKEIQANFTLRFPEGADMQTLLKGKTAIIKKLQQIDPRAVTQNALLDHAEEMGVDLMTDEQGAIIVMDDRDMTAFVNLLNEDYITSPITGERYEIIKKRPLKLKPQNEEEV